MSQAATAILQSLAEVDVKDGSTLDVNLLKVFTITSKSLDVLFRRARDAAIPVCPSAATLRFHDSRSEAISRLSKRLDVLELARMVGHRDLASLMSYYRASAEDLAKKLG